MSRARFPRFAVLALGAVLALAACTTVDDGVAPDPTDASPTTDATQTTEPTDTSEPTETPETAERITVLASFYPLQYVAEQVGGDLVTVTSLTPAGADAHSLELSPRVTREIGEADAVLYLSGFQAAVDTAIAERAPARVLDAADVVTLRPLAEGHDHDHGDEDHADDHADDDHDHGDDEHAEDEHDHGDLDPHFWLDPTLLADVGDAVGDLLAEADPANADHYAAGAAALRADLTGLVDELATGLGSCERDTVVVTHAAFGYLLDPHHLTQVGIAGIDPDTEPSPARLREIRAVVTEHDVTTIFTEVNLGPGVVETLATDLGVDVGVLDAIESQVDPAIDYRDAMLTNLTALRTGLGCS